MRCILAFLLLLGVPLQAQASWREASSQHFVIYSKQSAERLRDFATKLERFDKAIRHVRKIEDIEVGPANRLTIFVLDDRDHIEKLTARGVAGAYRPGAGESHAIIPSSSGDRSDIAFGPLAILLHEYSHHIMFNLSLRAAYPAWFIEGFAEFHATASFESDGSVVFGAPPGYRAIGLLRGNDMPIEKLLIADFGKLSAAQTDAVYGRGWLLTHYLTLGQHDRADQLTRYITAFARGEDPLTAARTTFGDLEALDRELEKYKLSRLNSFKIPSAHLQTDPIELRVLSPGEAAIMDVRIRTKIGVKPAEALAVYERARKIAATFPQDPAVQIVLAETAFAAKEYDAVKAAANLALAANPKLVEAYLFKARAEQQITRQSDKQDKAHWAAMRKIIAEANRIDPNDPRPLIEFYETFLRARERPSENAQQGLERALELAPQDHKLRITAALMYIARGQRGTARSLLLLLAHSPHASPLRDVARKIIADIDAQPTPTISIDLAPLQSPAPSPNKKN